MTPTSTAALSTRSAGAWASAADFTSPGAKGEVEKSATAAHRVIPAKAGTSNTRRLGLITSASDYWVARSQAGR
jgi:hypothetical protein